MQGFGPKCKDFFSLLKELQELHNAMKKNTLREKERDSEVEQRERMIDKTTEVASARV